MALLKFAMVVYFTLGSGIIDFIPRGLAMSKDAALILMQSGNNLPINYDYCNFDNTNYPGGKETLELWDTIDCKIGKYLGMQEHINPYEAEGENWTNLSENAPKTLIIILLFWSQAFVGGIVVTIVGATALAFLLTLTARMVQVYVIAVIAVYFLAFISPLIIPLVLFEYTKQLFDNWLKMLISYLLQPMMLFAFLAITFAITDFVMFGGNNEFCPNTNSIRMTNEEVSDGDNECTINEDETDIDCSGDSFSAGCILLKKTQIKPWEPFGANVWLPVWQTYGDANYGYVLSAFLKLAFVYFILNAILATFETIVMRLTDAIGAGASGMANLSPTKAAAATAGYAAAPASYAAAGGGAAAGGLARAAGFGKSGKERTQGSIKGQAAPPPSSQAPAESGTEPPASSGSSQTPPPNTNPPPTNRED